MANQPGKQYQCSVCGGTVVATKGGDGEIHCCSRPMERKS